MIEIIAALLWQAGGQVRRIRLDELAVEKTVQDWGEPRRDRSVGGRPLVVGGKRFAHGLGTHACSALRIALDGRVLRFTARVGVDGEVGRRGTIVFRILADGRERWRSPLVRGGDAPREVALDLRGVRALVLSVLDGGDGIDYDHADWCAASFTYEGKPPVAEDPPREEPYILTPPPPPEPRITGAKVLGVRPGRPVLHTIAATGERPMRFAAEGLPEGLRLDPESGRITGRVARAGTYHVLLEAANARGKDRAAFRLVVGERIALTPPMGWNSWNCWATAVDDEKIRAAAKALVDTGLIHHGWQYVNIDDCWMVKRNSKDPVLGGATRDERGRILANRRFPDMRALSDYVHSLGLKIGLYTSPGPYTCAGFEGAYGHERDDAERFAAWGFDYLKYDWCGYRSIVAKPSLEQMKEPYRKMGKILAGLDRDIVFSICQYGMGAVWTWGAEVGGNLWRTTGDITDTWSSMARIGFSQDAMAPFGGPGHWNDPDMLVVGRLGWGPKLRPTRLTPNEQYTHISLWCLLAAPLLLGCDLERLDDFTLNLLTNDEVLAVDQDPLGVAARRKARDGMAEVWARPLEGGRYAVGLFNRDEVPQTVRAEWRALGIEGRWLVRDLWRQQDLGVFEGGFAAEVPRHGVLLLGLRRPER